jgi:DNA-binding NarL/FixJ family response regulator
VADGLANKDIARRLGITEMTVKGHLSVVFSKLGVRNRTQAALLVYGLRLHQGNT